jgi:MerR family transcriptional regulator, light-induced transcriptional regulator
MLGRVSSVYTVKRAAELTGITPDTLRSWERRYGIVCPPRSEGGYRLYDDRALRRLAAMQALVSTGWSPQQAADHVLAEEHAATDVPRPGEAPDDGETLGDLTALTRAGVAFDGAALQRALDEGFALGSFELVVDRWLMPSLHVLGDGWRTGRITVAGEHFVSASVARRLAAAYEAAGQPAGARVLVGLARDSRHELGVLAFATALRRAGADVVYVGADLPATSWPEAAEAHDAVAAVVGVPTAEDVPAVREVVAELGSRAPRVRLFLGGSRQTAVDGGEPLGHRIAEAAHHLVATLGPTPPAGTAIGRQG